MTQTTKLPANTTEWRQACERAASFANKHGNGRIEHAEEYLFERGREHFGFESASLLEADREMEYLNTGETYCPTVCCENGKCFVSSWGDWLEQAEQKYCLDNNVTRCVYCGEFIPLSENIEWHDTACKACGHYVDGRDKKEDQDQKIERLEHENKHLREFVIDRFSYDPSVTRDGCDSIGYSMLPLPKEIRLIIVDILRQAH